MDRNSRDSSRSTLLSDVWLVTHLTGRVLDDALRPVGINGDEFGLYSLIFHRAPVTPTQISRWTGMAPTTVSGMLRRLTARDHLRHSSNPQDARSRMLALSAAGELVTAQGAEVLADVLGRVEAALDDPGRTRAALRELDAALRVLAQAAEHPHGATASQQSAAPPSVTYHGRRLRPAQMAEVRRFIEWLQFRDAQE